VKYRAVHWLLFPLLLCVSIGLKWNVISLNDWMLNTLLLIFLLGSLTLYLTFRKGKLINITNGFFSWGDILFLVAIIPLFETFNYLFFFTFGTMIVLLIHVLAHILKPQPTIPYAGYMGLVTIAYLLAETQINELITSTI
jgi:hypothetical protein